MKRTLGAFAALLLVATPAALALPTAPAGATTPPSLTVQHAATPVVASGGGRTVAVVQKSVGGKPGPLVAYERRGGRWGKPVDLTSTTAPYGGVAGGDGPQTQLAIGSDGVGAVVWLRKIGQRTDAVMRLHQRNGSWGAPRTLPGVWWLQGLAVNDEGDVAAIGWADNGDRMLVRVHGEWHSVAAPVDDAQIGIDDRGVVHVANVDTDRGGEGVVTVRRWTAKGGWTAPSTVTKRNEMAPDMSFAVQPNGTEYVAVGGVSKNWKSTYDTEAFWATTWRVAERGRNAASWTNVWSRDGAETLQMRADAGGVRLVWQQQSDPDANKRPQRLDLMSQLLGSAKPQALGHVEGTGPQMLDTALSAVVGGTAQAPSIAWRAWGPTANVGRLHLATPAGNRHYRTTYTHEKDAPEASVATGWLAYPSRVVETSKWNFPSDGTVKVVPIG